MKTLLSSLLLVSISGFAQTPPTTAATAVRPAVPVRLSGSMQVNGEAGPTQLYGRVKVQRCDKPTEKKSRSGSLTLQRNCDAPLYFNLNTAQSMPVGTYLVGFEDSIYPGFVTVDADRTTALDLIKVQVPAAATPAQANLKYRIYRDFTTLTEQKKIYFQIYYTGKHFFKLTSRYSFGDYYLTDGQRPDNVQWRTLDLCSSISGYGEAREQAKFVCQSWNNAKSMMDMADLYKFETSNSFDGQYQEAWITEPGDVQAIRHMRHLVSAPLAAGDFVSVFPGAYKILSEGRNAVATKLNTGVVTESYSADDLSRVFAADPDTTPEEAAIACTTADMWRTDQRSYCTSDKAEGCDRTTAKACVPLNIDMRFRKY